jgi:hypothetical protein
MLYDVLIANLDAITEEVEYNLCDDETTWDHGGNGEAGNGLIGQTIIYELAVTNGGQMVMVS